MSKIFSNLSGIAAIVLLVAVGGTLIALADSSVEIDPGARSAVGTAFTYQGQLTDGSQPADGRYDFSFALYDDQETGSQIGPLLTEVITVTSGLFSVELDFGSVFDGTALWLQIGVRPDGDTDPHTLLLPRQRLTAAPFATYAGTAPWSGLMDMPAGFADGIDDDTQYEAGTGLDLVGSAFAITTPYQLPQGCDPDQFVRWTGTGWACTEAGTGVLGWALSGNSGTTPGLEFLGTIDDAALQLHVNGDRALRIEPDDTSPNIVGGFFGNGVGEGVSGATIGGGGRDLAPNQVSGGFGTIGGGAGNTAGGYASMIGGGEGNSAGGTYAVIGGGVANTAGGDRSTVGGGSSNAAGYDYATVGGGSGNTAGAALATIAGGASNLVSGNYGTVGGGEYNATDADHATIGGGYYNVVSAAFGTIAGGGPSQPGNPTTTNNQVYDQYGAIGGGGRNTAGYDDADATSQEYATVSGGYRNTASGEYASAGGGNENTANGYASTVGGGALNSAGNHYATVGGGTSNSAGGQYSVVAGGRSNNASANYGTVPGGWGNSVGGLYGFAAGLNAHADHDGTFVWSDSTGALTSTGPDQFLIDASGGVGIGTNSPTQLLTVRGSAEMLSSEPVPLSFVESADRVLETPNAVYAAGDLLYVTSFATNTLSIWNVSNPADAMLVGYGTSNLLRPNDLFVSGQRAYVTSGDNSRLVVFDLSDPSAPDSLGSTGAGLANPVALYVAGKYAYVLSDGPGLIDGLAVLDVSDPTQIRLRDLTNDGMAAPTDLFVAGSRAYVTSAGNNSLVIYDISDPRPGQVQLLGAVAGPMYGPQGVFVSGPYAYVVSNSDDLVIFDISDPGNIVTAGSTGANLANPVDVVVAGDLAYVASSGNDRLAVFDVSNPADIVDLGYAETGDEPVALFMAGKVIYVANRSGNSVGVYEVSHLAAPALRVGNAQAGYLDVIDNAAVGNDLTVGGGLQVGTSGARIGGGLSVTGPDDSHILGALSVGGAGALISDTLVTTQWITAPTHALDVIGEGRFRVNDYTNLVLRSPNAGGDEDAYIDLIRSAQTTVVTPSARIEFDTAAPFTHTTSLRFYTQAEDDTQMQPRLEVTSNGDVRPGADNAYTLGTPERRWQTVYSVGGIESLSDARYKENVSPLPYGLESVMALRPVTYDWAGKPDDGQHYGLIAQEVREILPDVVSGDGEDGMLSLNYGELVPVLVQAVQDQQAEITAQAGQIASLEARLDALEQGGPAGSAQPQGLNLLAAFGFGGLALGAVSVAGLRRMGGRP